MSLPIIISFSVLGGIIFLIVLGLAFRANPWRTGFFLILPAVIVILVIGGIYFPFILLTIVTGLLFLFSFATLATSWTWLASKLNVARSTLLKVWNPRKAYGGAIFGDLANAVGIFAGMGATRLLSSAVWWWIGQIAVVLALAVGLSLLWRSFFERVKNEAGLAAQENNIMGLAEVARLRRAWKAGFDKANRAKRTAVLGYFVGTMTWFSLMLMQSGNVNQVEDTRLRWLWVAIVVLLFAYLLFLTIYYVRNDALRNAGQTRRGDIFVLVCFWIATLAIMVFTIILRVDVSLIAPSPATEISSTVIGIVGIVLWIVAEGESWLTLSLQWNKEGFDSVEALDYLVWEKNLWEMAGGLTTIVFLRAVLERPLMTSDSTAL
ncbi:MAG: hypothetical protein AAF614_08070, partial [Chloroflexota bacterium]